MFQVPLCRPVLNLSVLPRGLPAVILLLSKCVNPFQQTVDLRVGLGSRGGVGQGQLTSSSYDLSFCYQSVSAPFNRRSITVSGWARVEARARTSSRAAHSTPVVKTSMPVYRPPGDDGPAMPGTDVPLIPGEAHGDPRC